MGTEKPDIDKLASAKDIDKLVECLMHADNSVRYRAAGALGELGSEAKLAVPYLINALEHWDSMTRAVAAGALGAIGTDAREAAPTLERLLTDPDPVVKMCAASALRDLCPGTKNSLDSLTEMLERKNRPRRKDAAWAIGDAMSTEIDPAIFIVPMF